jgi:hypothetical protein
MPYDVIIEYHFGRLNCSKVLLQSLAVLIMRYSRVMVVDRNFMLWELERWLLMCED